MDGDVGCFLFFFVEVKKSLVQCKSCKWDDLLTPEMRGERLLTEAPGCFHRLHSVIHFSSPFWIPRCGKHLSNRRLILYVSTTVFWKICASLKYVYSYIFLLSYLNAMRFFFCCCQLLSRSVLESWLLLHTDIWFGLFFLDIRSNSHQGQIRD